MIKKLQNTVKTLLVTMALLVPTVAMPIAVGAQSTIDIDENLCAGANFSTTDTNCNAQEAQESVNTILTTVINIFSLLVGVISVVMIIVGGLKYITSGGEAGNVTGAKNTILYAIIGLVIVALAQVIVRFVLAKVST